MQRKHTYSRPPSGTDINSNASVPTAHASRYLQQLCKHWSHNLAVSIQRERRYRDLPAQCTRRRLAGRRDPGAAAPTKTALDCRLGGDSRLASSTRSRAPSPAISTASPFARCCCASTGKTSNGKRLARPARHHERAATCGLGVVEISCFTSVQYVAKIRAISAGSLVRVRASASRRRAFCGLRLSAEDARPPSACWPRKMRPAAGAGGLHHDDAPPQASFSAARVGGPVTKPGREAGRDDAARAGGDEGPHRGAVGSA